MMVHFEKLYWHHSQAANKFYGEENINVLFPIVLQ